MRNGKQLYRNPEKGKIAGVCSGVAEYFGLETWLVRILVVTGFFLLAGPFIFVAYIAAWFILDKKPKHLDNARPNPQAFSRGKGWTNPNSGQVKEAKVEVKTKVWQAGEPPKQAFHDIRNRFEKTENRLRKMETYVTSKEYQLNKEISRL
ncbi:envelope stress response membrane protein PspC [Alteromonas sp. BMJM2]|uniref:envelope stress response membrane protein PspC n=1 Tax=Alteromonas sp. BMJM2 TaxID=2954241 RepID=UPI0022B3CFDA|nr:envelope stress response membrane protein PspC [Alteromonas sp. BMJM2]